MEAPPAQSSSPERLRVEALQAGASVISLMMVGKDATHLAFVDFN